MTSEPLTPRARPAALEPWPERATGPRPVDPSRGVLRPLGLDEVELTGGQLAEWQARNGDASLPHIEYWLDREGWIGNFDAAVAGTVATERRGREFADSEVYKILEALAWEYGRTGDVAVDRRFRDLAARVVAAQEPDGYLNTHFGRPGQPERYSDLEWGHELYCFGHLVQAGVARARTVGLDDDFVRAVIRAADHVCDAFGPNGIPSVCGHPEIELALAELHRTTGDPRYLDQARLFIDRRGHQVLDDIAFGRAYFQDDLPVREADVLRGHAVRALYLAAGATDLAVETGDDDLLESVRRQWRTTVERRTYVTGGMGSHHLDESFGDDHVLPADRAYAETCAGVASIMFSWRLLLADGSSHYGDLIERTLHNIIATSPSQDGTRFFYANTLHRREAGVEPDAERAAGAAATHLRAPWFGVSCCPTNLARTFASLAGYVATADRGGIQLHQYVSATVRTALPGGARVALAMTTDYPRTGTIAVRIVETGTDAWTLSFRVPEWARSAELALNGAPAGVVEQGYARLRHAFAADDRVELTLPVEPRFTAADPRVDAVRGCLAVERGPQVLCLESHDTPGQRHVDDFVLDPTAAEDTDDGVVVTLTARHPPQTPGPWPYRSTAEPADPDGSGEPGDPGRSGADGAAHRVVLRPYAGWGNRGPGTMRIWLPVE